MLQSSFDDVLGGTDITKRAAIPLGLPSYWPTNPPLQSKTIRSNNTFNTYKFLFVIMALRNSISDKKDVEAIASHLDHANTAATNGGLSAEDMEFVANFPEEKKKKKVLAKIDWRLMPMVKPSSTPSAPSQPPPPPTRPTLIPLLPFKPKKDHLNGNCWGKSDGFGCGIFLEGEGCKIKGYDMWDWYQKIRKDGEKCKKCGKVEYKDGCTLKIDYVTGCNNHG
ncbi:hypothetical protein FBULB1_4743 [Fusarium bulbicola]|nr:hypothetical protein FBULB1_4743 [Fusarium bulbicola]